MDVEFRNGNPLAKAADTHVPLLQIFFDAVFRAFTADAGLLDSPERRNLG